MIDADELRSMLANSIAVSSVGDGLRVKTQCLYPSNGAVSVMVRGGTNEFVVSDEGGAAKQIGMSGISETLSDRQVKALIRSQGLKVQNGAVFSPVIPAAALSGAIVLVANASKEVAEWGMGHLKYTIKRNFRADLAQLLDRHFRDSLKHDSPVLGASNKPHKFGHVIYLSGERRLIVDPVVNDPSSINARVVANMDVRMAHDPSISQIIVYDDAEPWDAANLSLLELGAKTVAFSRAEEAIARLAA